MTAAVIFDVDGTLVDTNYLHVTAWWHALGERGHVVPMVQVHRLMGQGSERMVATILGHDDEAIVNGHSEHYKSSWDRIQALPGAAALLRRVKSAGADVVLATSASAEELERLREVIDADDAIDHATSKDDAEESKPEPDIIQAALAAGGYDPAECVLVGDTVWDIEAASKAGVRCVGVLSGGIGEDELRDAGAIAVYRDCEEILSAYDDSPLAAVSAGTLKS